MSVKKPLRNKEVNRNVRLQKFYPLGITMAIFELLEMLRGYTYKIEEIDLIDQALETLHTYDKLVRQNRYSKY